MKHTWSITLLLLGLFLLSHLIGFFIIKHYLPDNQALPFNIEKPNIEPNISYIPIITSIIVATLLALILAKFQAFRLWKFWFLLSIIFTLTLALGAFVSDWIALIIAIAAGLWKTFKPNPIIHNVTEVFVYGGLAAIFVPVLDFKSVSILLILISIYDMIAVWKTKHMVSLAQFQNQTKVFAGLLIPYGRKENVLPNKKIQSGVTYTKVHIIENQAMLGGGDIGFSLLFSGVILKSTIGIIPALIVSLCAAAALFGLFMIAEKKKFYPAMPFLTLGCFIGYMIIHYGLHYL